MVICSFYNWKTNQISCTMAVTWNIGTSDFMLSIMLFMIQRRMTMKKKKVT